MIVWSESGTSITKDKKECMQINLILIFLVISIQTNDPLVSRVHPAEDVIPYPNQPPPPAPPTLSKMDIYSDPSVFSDIDQVAINVSLSLPDFTMQPQTKN